MEKLDLTRDLLELLELLICQNIKFLIIGGQAMALHSAPRYTKDLDIWINNDKDSAFKLEQALLDFGFATKASIEFQKQNQMIILGVEPNRVDILNTPKGIDFEDCYLNRSIANLGAYSISFLSKKDLIKNKLAVGRPQDLVDIETLNNIN